MGGFLRGKAGYRQTAQHKNHVFQRRSRTLLLKERSLKQLSPASRLNRTPAVLMQGRSWNCRQGRKGFKVPHHLAEAARGTKHHGAHAQTLVLTCFLCAPAFWSLEGTPKSKKIEICVALGGFRKSQRLGRSAQILLVNSYNFIATQKAK